RGRSAFFLQAKEGRRDPLVTGVQTCALPISALGRPPLMEITDKYRAGDIRHCFGDISAITDLLGYRPRVRLKQGIQELVNWLKSQNANDHVEDAMERLNVYGLVA